MRAIASVRLRVRPLASLFWAREPAWGTVNVRSQDTVRWPTDLVKEEFVLFSRGNPHGLGLRIRFDSYLRPRIHARVRYLPCR